MKEEVLEGETIQGILPQSMEPLMREGMKSCRAILKEPWQL